MMVTPLMPRCSSDLPEEMIISILTRVPARSIGRFRCVSKSWLSMLSSKYFIETHLKMHKEEEEKLLIISTSHTLHTLNVTFLDVAVAKKLNFPAPLDDNWLEIVGSCNGLVLAVNGEDKSELFVINPTTLERVQAPKSPLALPPGESFWMYGFGYDETDDDYKIVTLSYYEDDTEYDNTFVDVYSLRIGLWRRVENYEHAYPEPASGVFVGSAIHWLAWDYSSPNGCVIAAFDLGNEKFRKLPAPKELDEGKLMDNKLVVLGGCLCMFVEQTTNDVWMMKEYGVQESWVKVITINDPENNYAGCLNPLCLIGDHNKAVVMEVDEEKLELYDLKAKRFMDMEVDGAPAIFANVWTFVDSLVSPRLLG